MRPLRRHPPPSPPQRRKLEKIIEAAIARRTRLFGPFAAEPRTNAYRLIHGEGDGLDGIQVDAYAGYLVIQPRGRSFAPLVARLGAILAATLHPHGIIRKLRPADAGTGRVEDAVLSGSEPPSALTVREEEIPFEVQLLGAAHTGLFTDMRVERVRLRRLARDRRVLNTFAYTGSFSVAAALGAALEVATVDLSAGALERAKRNFTLSGLDPSRHHFARMESREYLRMAARRGWRFGAIILDPPTAAKTKSGHWSLRADYPELLALALAVLEREGLIWVAANTQGMRPVDLDRMIRRALGGSGRAARTIARSGLPPDYPTLRSHPESRYLKVHVLQVT